MITHIDVGYRRQVARLLGIEPTIVILCGATDGDTIWDDPGIIRSVGGFPAACTCGVCKRIAGIMYDYDCGVQEAQKRLKEMEAIS